MLPVTLAMPEKLEHERSNESVEEPLTPRRDSSLEPIEKGRWERLWPVIACGAGLFSDGYLNGVCTTKHNAAKSPRS